MALRTTLRRSLIALLATSALAATGAGYAAAAAGPAVRAMERSAW